LRVCYNRGDDASRHTSTVGISRRKPGVRMTLKIDDLLKSLEAWQERPNSDLVTP